MNIKKLNEELRIINEKYEALGTIVKNDDGYNILDKNNKEMLDKSYPSLKKMLQDIVDNL